MTDYTPIDCGRYSEYELAILHRQRLRITWRDEAGVVHVELLMPRDLRTERGEEFLVAEKADGSVIEFRLDHIRRTEAV